MTYRKLNACRFPKPTNPCTPGPAPQLQWIEVKLLVVDGTYQREIGHKGSANVQFIANNFDWSKFAPVIVAPIEGGLFAIVDGQHRTTAAILCGFELVPCQSVQADRSKQAAAFAAVNGRVTRTTPHQLFHARIAAGESEALTLEEICKAADVRILRRSIPIAKLRAGDTHAVNALERCLRAFGRDTLITALQCVTRSSDGNSGFLRATIIEGLCVVLDANKIWRDSGEKLLRAMDAFVFPDMWSDISAGRDKIFPGTATKVVAEKVEAFLKAHMDGLKKSSPRLMKAA